MELCKVILRYGRLSSIPARLQRINFPTFPVQRKVILRMDATQFPPGYNPLTFATSPWNASTAHSERMP
jgi:hypothetical protein